MHAYMCFSDTIDAAPIFKSQFHEVAYRRQNWMSFLYVNVLVALTRRTKEEDAPFLLLFLKQGRLHVWVHKPTLQCPDSNDCNSGLL